MEKRKESKARKAEEVVLLKDLAPRRDVKGGAGKIVFGEQLVGAEGGEASTNDPRSRAEPQ